jgi:hypothetical protein
MQATLLMTRFLELFLITIHVMITRQLVYIIRLLKLEGFLLQSLQKIIELRNKETHTWM